MKPYLVAKHKVNLKVALAPNSKNFNDDEWINYLKHLINDDANSTVAIIRHRFPDLKDFLEANYTSSKTLGEKVYRLLNPNQVASCIICGSETKFNGINTGYKKYCSLKCKNNNPEVKEKIKNTFMKRYGGTCPFNSNEIADKIKITNIKKYGSENVFGSESIRAKIKNTNINRFGTENPAQSAEVKNKIKTTVLSRYGCEYSFQHDEVKEKCKTSWREKYGVENPMQHFQILEKSLKNSKKIKTKKLSSGKIISFQGYEDVVIDHILKFFSEDDLLIGKDVPRFKYSEKHRIYFPDMFLPSVNTIIEVKSRWTLSSYDQYLELFEKMNAVINAGFNFILFICNKHSILEIYKMETTFND